MSKNRIEHEGRIIEISNNSITVEIINKSACASCHAKGACGASDEAIKEVEIPHTISTLSQNFEVGETVNVVLSQSLGLKAVILSYAVPLVVLLVALGVCSALGCRELVSALVALGSVAVYYIFIYIFRSKLAREFSFSIEKKE